MAFNINGLVGPLAEATTPIGKLHLYGWKISSLHRFSDLTSETLTIRIRNFFQYVSSFDKISSFAEGEPLPLTEQEVCELLEIDLENLADKYVKVFKNKQILREISHRLPMPLLPMRERDESAITFLDRLLKHEIYLHKASELQMIARVTKLRTTIHLKNLRKYIKELEDKFNADKESLLAKQKSMPSKYGAMRREFVNIDFRDDYYTIDEIYLGLYRKSMLVTIYSFLEYTMMDLCDLVKQFYNSSFGAQDLKGKGIIRSRLYLEKVAKINFDKLNAEWADLLTLNKVRNHIVHADGVDDVVSNNLTKLVNRTQGLSVKNHGRLLVDSTYIDSSITTVENFLEKLYSKAF